MSKIEQELASFPSTSITARVISVLGSVVPGAPALPSYSTVDEAAAAVLGGVPPDVIARAHELLADPRIDQALFAARTIDTSDTGLTIVSGVRSAVSLFFGKGGRSERLMIDATHLKAHRTAASLFKKGLFPDVSDAPKAA